MKNNILRWDNFLKKINEDLESIPTPTIDGKFNDNDYDHSFKNFNEPSKEETENLKKGFEDILKSLDRHPDNFEIKLYALVSLCTYIIVKNDITGLKVEDDLDYLINVQSYYKAKKDDQVKEKMDKIEKYYKRVYDYFIHDDKTKKMFNQYSDKLKP